MSRRGRADGSRLLGWDAVRARDQRRRARRDPECRTLHPSDAACTAWLRRHHARLEPPSATRPYFAIYLGPRFFTAGATRQTALERAMRSRIPPPPT